MAEINRLSTELSNLIAAGEVVERPASVVKELVENSIDAGADKIEVEIRNGGISYIRVTDNGKGMVSEDAKVAFFRHATSKIQSEDDLFSIATLGFRGEALAAVSAVSKIDLFTKHRFSEDGIHMTLEGGLETSFNEHGCPQGTTIVVQDLFYNTPARMKFLKNDKTEGSHVAGILEHIAVSKPKIAIKFIKDGKISFSTLGDGNLQKAIYSVYGKEFAKGLLNVSGHNQGIDIYGVISPISLSRANKNMQNFFINGRYIKSKLLYAAVERAYQGRLISGRMPICFLNLDMPFASVDVNVHPTKLEVKFANEKRIFDVVYGMITDTLNSVSQFSEGGEQVISDTPTNPINANDVTTYPSQYFDKGVVNKNNDSVTEFYKKIMENKAQNIKRTERDRGFSENLQATFINDRYTQKEYPVSSPFVANDINKNETVYSAENIASNEKISQENLSTRDEILKSWVSTDKKQSFVTPKIVGEIFKTYIIVEHEGQMKIIDKHAVHEKMIYNRLLSNELSYFGQMLIEPLNISLTREEKSIVLDNSKIFEELGFGIEDMGQNLVGIRKAPSYVKFDDISNVLTEVIEKVKNCKLGYGDLVDEIVKSIACKAAVKAGFINVTEELKVIVDKVFADNSLSTCPHGRPTTFCISKYQIEKFFKRS